MESATTGFFFDSDGARLYGYLHAAHAPLKPMGVVLVHPFMEERQDSHAVLRDLAERLSERGFAAMRFDLYGCGDSEGEWEGGTLERWVGDVTSAARVLRDEARVDDVALVGLRFGATLAALAAGPARASRLAMVQPVVRGETYASELLMANLAAEMVLHRRVGVTREGLVAQLDAGGEVNLFGYRFTSAQYRALRTVDLARDLGAEGAPALVVDVARTPTAREPRDLQALAAALGARGTLVRAVEPQSLYAEGKIHVTRADEVCRAVLTWMER